MPISEYTEATNIIASLPNDPNDSGGLSAAELKDKFDENAANIKTYLNDTLVAELNSATSGSSGADQIGYGGDVPSVTTIKDAIDKIYEGGSGTIPADDTITTAKIVNGAVTNAKLADDAVTADKIVNGSITKDKMNPVVLSRLPLNIGDMITTLRTDVGSDYLLCNGASFDFATYSDLAAITPLTPGTWTTDTNSSSIGFLYLRFGNNYWMGLKAGGLYFKQGTPIGAYAAKNTAYSYSGKLEYLNAYWIIPAYDGTSNGLLYRANDPDGGFSFKQLNVNNGTITHAGYGDSYFAACTGDSTIYYTNGAGPSGTWTSKTTPSAVRSIANGNGYWVGVGSSGSLCYVQGAPSGTWTSNAQGANNFDWVYFINGYWIAIYNGGMYYKQGTPDGTWTNAAVSVKDLTFDGFCLVGTGSGSGEIKYNLSGTPVGTWTTNTYSPVNMYGIAYGNNYLAASRATYQILYKNTYNLPSISIGANTYIKACREVIL